MCLAFNKIIFLISCVIQAQRHFVLKLSALKESVDFYVKEDDVYAQCATLAKDTMPDNANKMTAYYCRQMQADVRGKMFPMRQTAEKHIGVN